jgi:site-specific DNA-methyltransferase (adenine-specific)
MKEQLFMNEDCLIGMKRYPDKYFDLAIVDPPYGIKRFEKPSGTTRFKSSKMMQETGLIWDIIPKKEYFIELFRVSKNQIIWGANNFELPSSEYFCIWDKEQTVDNFASAEYAWVGGEFKKPAKVFRYSIHKHNQVNKIHPTEKPIALYKWLIKNYAKEGYKILDTHVGSASSLIAFESFGLDYVGFEIDKEYYDKAKDRIEKEREQLKLFAPSFA